MNHSDTSHKLLDAASTVLLRDRGEGAEVLLLKGSGELSFAPGCWVFPGGKVDARDGGGDSRFVRAAVRETLEETGLSIDGDSLDIYL